MTSVTFDGTCISDRFALLSADRPAPPMDVELEALAGADGAFPRGASLGASTVRLRLLAKAVTGDARRAAERELAALLDAREPRRLEFSDDGGLYYLAQPSGARQAEHYRDAVLFEVEFALADPVMHGAYRTAQVGTSATTIQVGGTYPALPSIVCASATRSASGLWGVRLDEGAYMRVPVAASGSVAVAIDGRARTAKVAGAASMITLDSDWLELAPGAHTVRVDQGGGEALLSWTERWL